MGRMAEWLGDAAGQTDHDGGKGRVHCEALGLRRLEACHWLIARVSVSVVCIAWCGVCRRSVAAGAWPA